MALPLRARTTFVVQVNGDTLHELNEDFFVNVTNVSGATLTDGQGRGTIINDDAAPSLSIADINVTEGNSGTTPAVLTVTLSAASALPVQVQYATANVTAVAPTDYTAASGTLSFPPGTTTQTITVLVNGDTTVEPDETFQVNLSNPVNASVADGSAVVTIVSDDAPVVVGPTVLPPAKAGVAYSQTFSATGGTGSYTYALSGTLPTGLTFNTSTGTLSGTPTQAGTFSFSVSATDSSPTPNMGTAFYGLIVSGPTLALPGAALPAAVRGQPFSSNRGPVSGGNAPYTFSVTGVLPTGLAISPNGVISGTPTAVGTFNFTVVARDSTSGTGAPFDVTENLTITVAESLPLAGNSTLSVGFNAPAANVALILSGGPATSLTLAAAPTHGTALVTGPTTISYQPATGYAGSDSFSYTATGPGGTSTPATVTVTVADPTITIGASGGFTAVAGMPYSQTFTWSGGSAPFSGYQVSNLPAGLSVTATTANSATVSGTPTASGTFNINASARDSSTGNGPYTVGQLFSLVVAGPSLSATPAVLPTATAGNPYQQAITATGGIAPYQVALTGTLPVGMSFNAASGTLSGTPTQSGTCARSATITDSTGGTPASLTQSYSLVVASPVLVATPGTLAGGTAGSPYQMVFTASGGIAPYHVALSGTLPAGLSFDAASATLSGTPTQSGSFTVSATITDSTTGTPARLVQAYTLTIAAPALSLTPVAGALPASTAGSSYTLAFATTGGLAPYRYTLASGALPAGLVLDASTGRVAGTPSVAGSFGFSVAVSDATTGGAGSATQAYTLNVSAPVLTLTPSALPAGLFGHRYEQRLAAAGGTAPYRYVLSAGALPDGVTLEPAGGLAGTPTAAGAFAFTITATDALGFSGSHDYVVQIAPRPDPSRDPEVRGLLSAQRDAARRFANSQIENLQQRMQRLHGASRSNGFSNNLSLSYAPRRCEPMVGNVPGPDCDAQRRQPFDREPAPAVSDPAANSQAPLGLWVGGTIRSGRNEGGQRSGVDFETDGVTIGADRRLSDTLAVGAALGDGRDRRDVGERGSRRDGQAYSMALYASYSLGRSLFVDALVGHQLLDYTLRRYVTADGSFAHARRNGSQWFGSLAFGADLARGDWQFTPYARLDASQGSLDRYAEQGSDLFALRYGSQDVDATTGNAGLRVEVRRVARWGAWTPQLRVEYQHDFSGSGVATLQYADLGELPFYRTTLDGFDRNRWVLGAGVMFDFGRNWGLKVDYRGLVGSGDDRDHGVQISLDKQL
ncbi:hypothetical protein G6F65_010534 [Rhizopus arrhizus]|nr:hypothetical protein G6F65_010534 [Rhizopus arrhizus]